MKKYILTADRFSGNVLFGYSDSGTLTLYENTTDLQDGKHLWLLNRLPKHISQVKAFADEAKCKLEELPEDLSFDAFWEKYGKKINKKRCEPLWKKMNDAQRMTCLRSIEPYKGYLLRTGYRSQLDPENYLKNGSYETNWNREK